MHLPLLHFNDVYRVSKQKLQSGETIDVSQFARRVDGLRDAWPKETGGLLLFSGDLFSPSVESSVTRGSHMVPVINEISPDVALIGNHDFDFGYPHLLNLMSDCKFPWILSNIVDSRTGTTPEGIREFCIFERGNTKIGVIGLVENWINIVPAWPPEFMYRDMAEVGLELSKKLRGEEYGCDVILALTHARLPNDITLAKSLFAHENVPDASNKHGVDILFGGHDHMYYIGKGTDSYENYERVSGEPGTEDDDGVRLVKSGTDFRDLSELILELEGTPPGSVRSKIVTSLRGRRHEITPDLPSSETMNDIVAKIRKDVSSSFFVPVCYTLEEWDVRSTVVRTDESAFGNWIADVVRHAYDDAIYNLGDHEGGADGVMLCGGALRGDSRYGPGEITIGDILEILPFDDAMVVIEMDGKSIWDTFESALSMYPAQEGRFPVISGFRIEWDSRRPPGQRILGLWLTTSNPEAAVREISPLPADEAVKGEPILRETDGKQYKVVTRDWMYRGHDGYEPLMGKHCFVDDESGMNMSTIVRKFLLGSQYIHKMKQLSYEDVLKRNHINTETDSVILRAREKWRKEHPDNKTPSPTTERWLEVTQKVLKASQEHCRAVIAEALRVCSREHMSEVDGVDGQGVRRQEPSVVDTQRVGRMARDDLVTVRPVLDGRLKDVARPRR